MKRCIIVGAGECPPGDLAFRRRADDLMIAADGGLAALQAAGVTPDLVLGDFDSFGSLPTGGNVIRLPCEKDDTDMAAAVNEGWRRGYRAFLLLGGLFGSRVSHTAANFQLLLGVARRGGAAELKCGATRAFALTAGQCWRFGSDKAGLISLFAAGGEAVVTLKGLRYPLTRAPLHPYAPLGVSNAFTGRPGGVLVHAGALYVVLEQEEA